MNLMFWRKKTTEESGDNSADETLVATEAGTSPPKPGFWTRLKSTLSSPHKKIEPDESVDAELSPRSKGGKHPDAESGATPLQPGFLTRLKNSLFPPRRKSEPAEEEEAEPTAKCKREEQDENTENPPAKPSFLTRLKCALFPSRKKKKTDDEENLDDPISSAKRVGRTHPDEEPIPSDSPAEKPKKWLIIMLALLIPLAAGGGFFAATKLLPQQQATPSKNEAIQEKVDEKPLPKPTETDEQTPQSEIEDPLAEPSPQQIDNASTPTTEDPESPAEELIAEAPADEDVPAQIQAMKKQNQEMQAQIEALKKQSTIERPARPATSPTPREGVLIINGKNAKESAQGLKKVIEGMNAASADKDTEKK